MNPLEFQLWVVGVETDCDECEEAWRMVGVFDSLMKAEDCAMETTGDESYRRFVAPLKMNDKGTTEVQDWDGLYVPSRDGRKT